MAYNVHEDWHITEKYGSDAHHLLFEYAIFHYLRMEDKNVMMEFVQ